MSAKRTRSSRDLGPKRRCRPAPPLCGRRRDPALPRAPEFGKVVEIHFPEGCPDLLAESHVPPAVLASNLRTLYERGQLDAPIQVIVAVDPSDAHALIFLNVSDHACALECGQFRMESLGLRFEVPSPADEGQDHPVARHLEFMQVRGAACQLAAWGPMDRCVLFLEGEKGWLATNRIREGILMLAFNVVIDGRVHEVVAHYCILKQSLEAAFSSADPA
ncbi:MAG: hypothetical protein HY291_11515 [Planctomycetes bacterium]|nr:hypothetical protein [Planctomycetota bacterium]